MHHRQIHSAFGGLFERFLAKCFSNSSQPWIYLLFSPNPIFIPRCLDITGSSSSWKASLSSLCHWTSSLPSSKWNLNLRLICSCVVSSLKRRIRSSLTRFLQLSYTIYPTVSEEQRYWIQAARGQKELQRSDARFAGTKVRHLHPNTLQEASDPEPHLPPLVMYYVPALLPVYRDTTSLNSTRSNKHRKPYVSPKIYCKWHRMVFPGSEHPTIKEASKLRNLYDAQDMEEICRISCMLPDNVIFPVAPTAPWTWTPKYQIMWQKWLISKPLRSVTDLCKPFD